MRLFGTDGIRGVAGEYPLDKETINRIGAESMKVLKDVSSKRAVVLGRDTRESGSWISEILDGSMSSQGVKIFDAGVIPTPGVAYLTAKHKFLSGVVISASHNPFRDNGIKFFSSKGTKLSENIEKKIETGILSPHAAEPHPKEKNILKSPELIKDYKGFLKSVFPEKYSLRGLKIVIDCANGATYKVAPEIFGELGAEVTALNVHPDGRNINSGCGATHPEKMAESVKKHGAFCGMSFDGDGDRVIFADENGVVRDGDYFLAICAKHLKEKNELKGNLLVTTVMANLGLYKAMESLGVNTVRTPVGDKYVFEGLINHDGVLGGEQSGHIIFRKYLSTGDGILSALQILEVLLERNKTLSELCGIMRKYPQVLQNTHVAKKVPIEDLLKTSELIKECERKLGNDGRALVRYSGTENLLRVMIEGPDKNVIDKMADEISDTAKEEIERLKN
ncbi:MAG: phosphoglucosamine mutase [Elusimicrobiota bacterium]